MKNLRPRPRWGRKNKRLPVLYPVLVLILAVGFLALWDDGAAEELAVGGAIGETRVTTPYTPEISGAEDGITQSYPLDIDNISLHLSDKGVDSEIPLEEYLVGVVAGEMPTNFAPEALKAQAVIARTYGVGVVAQGGQLCDDPGHCQCYYDNTALAEKWGDNFQENLAICTKAVEETAGEIILYQGEIAKTFFHSTCGGQTSSAAEVWGEEIPYLQSVACSWDNNAPRYRETVTLSLDELPYLLNIDGEGDVPVAAGTTDSGRVEAVTYGGRTIKATDFRKSLTLNSTDFSIEPQGNNVVISTKGFGHGVGLCQYGANGMAQEGSSYREIISYYYTGIEFGKITPAND